MALIPQSTYKPPPWLFNGHLETIFPPLFRRISAPTQPKKITIKTPDNDFFDLDYYDNNANKTIIISHGLEGNNKRPYMIGMAKKFFNGGWNVVAWNYRGCNGLVNNSIKSYHSGFTEDLEEVIKFAATAPVKAISLVGFSLGGNLTLKYLGNGNQVNTLIKSAVVFSVPLDLYRGCLEISKPSNFIYSTRFLKSLKKKVRDKAVKMPDIRVDQLVNVRDLKSFDDYFTAPMHGFRDAMDYYQSCSALYILDNIQTATLIVNAINDPFLPSECYPYSMLESHEFVDLETPACGGHVGFCSSNGNEFYWSEKRAYEFIESVD